MELKESALRAYVTGFVLSVLLTIGAYCLVVKGLLGGLALVTGIVVLAIIQLAVQLFFFLHLGQEEKPRWKSMTFLFMLLVLIIVVFGSLWIMQNLNYHMHTMPPAETDTHIMQEEGIYR